MASILVHMRKMRVWLKIIPNKKKVSNLHLSPPMEPDELTFSTSSSITASNSNAIAPNGDLEKTKSDVSSNSRIQFGDPEDLKKRHKVKFYTSLIGCKYEEGDELTWESKNKGKLLSYSQWQQRVDAILRYNDIFIGNDAKEMAKLKKVFPNLHHWLKKFHAEIDENGKKKLLAKKKIKKKTN